MYSMYSRDFAGPIYNRQVKKPSEEKYSLEGAANDRSNWVQKNYFLVPHKPGFQVRTTDEVNSLYSLRLL